MPSRAWPLTIPAQRRSATLALLAPLDEIAEETLTLLFAAKRIHPEAATQKLVELTTRSQSLPIARQPVFGRLEASPAGKRRCKVCLTPFGMTMWRLRERVEL